MIETRRTGGNRLDVIVRGVIDENDLGTLFERLDGDFDLGGEQSLMLDLRELVGLTFAAHVRDIVDRARLSGRRGKLRRVALVGGPRRLRWRARLHALILPGVEIRTFDARAFAAAGTWLDATRASAVRVSSSTRLR